jgi:hypothetical protein
LGVLDLGRRLPSLVRRSPPWQGVSIALTLAAIVAVFVEIPIVSNFAFWVMAANYLLVVAGTGRGYFIVVEWS